MSCVQGKRMWESKMLDAAFVAIPFVFLGLCLLYVRAAHRL